jgi:hypothetical protein
MDMKLVCHDEGTATEFENKAPKRMLEPKGDTVKGELGKLHNYDSCNMFTQPY